MNRRQGERGFCGEKAEIRASWAGLHFGEEPSITGQGGSGTIFFTGCTLKCSICQNAQLSKLGMGREVTVAELSTLMLLLQVDGAENINLVTGTHFAPGLVQAVARARVCGLKLPIIWNSSGYERLETLELLSGAVDVFLPDCKTLTASLSGRLMGAANYPKIVLRALDYMSLLKPLRMEGGRIAQGVIVRHLVLPGYLDSTREVLRWFSSQLYGRARLSLMFQYTPVHRLSDPTGGKPAPLGRRISKGEYEQVFSWLEELGIEEGYVQELAADSNWLPDFSRRNPFTEENAKTLWHFRAKRYLNPGL